MEYFIETLEKSLHIDIPLLSLAGAFILIDAVATINSDKEEASPFIFKTWFETYLPSYLKFATADNFYNFRNSLLHRVYGTNKKNRHSFSTLLFFPPGSKIQGHNNRFSVREKHALNLDIPSFVKDVISAAQACLKESPEQYEKHKAGIITLHSDGLPPFVNGSPVIGSAIDFS